MQNTAVYVKDKKYAYRRRWDNVQTTSIILITGLVNSMTLNTNLNRKITFQM